MVFRGDGRSDERAGALPGAPGVGTSGRGPCVIDAERFEYAHAAGRFILPAPAAGGRAPGAAGMLLLDRIQDPGNLGTILRTADAFDLPVLLTNGCADPFSEKTVRASMGAVFRRPPQSAPMEDVLRVCHAAGIPIAATALSDTACDLREVDLKRHLVVIGSEGQGICPELLAASDRQIIIPMQPRCESLNAAVAAAIVLWQMRP